MIQTVAEKFIDNANRDDGASVNAFGKTPETGYMVSVFPVAEELHAKLTPKIIEDFFYTWNVELRDPNIYVGAWLAPEGWYLDLSVNVMTFLEAGQLAVEHRQLAIYNLDTKQEIRL